MFRRTWNRLDGYSTHHETNAGMRMRIKAIEQVEKKDQKKNDESG